MSTSIDDLLDDGVDTVMRPRRPRLTLWGQAVETLLLSAAFAFGLWILLRALTRLDIPYLLFFAGFLTFLTTVRVVGVLRPPVLPKLSTVFPEPTARLADRPFAEAKRWVDRLDWVRGDPRQFERTIAPAITAVVDEKLRLRYGITRASQPERAAQLLGPRLTAFLNSPPLKRAPNVGELTALVTELEAL